MSQQNPSTKVVSHRKIPNEKTDLVEKKFWTIFIQRGTLQKKNTKFFSQPSIAIHTPIESPSRVDIKYFVFKDVYFDFWPKEA